MTLVAGVHALSGVAAYKGAISSEFGRDGAVMQPAPNGPLKLASEVTCLNGHLQPESLFKRES